MNNEARSSVINEMEWIGLDLGGLRAAASRRQPAQREDKRRPSMNFLLPSLKKSNEFNEREEWKGVE